MAITAVLVDASPFRLRYLLSQNGVISSPPVAADGRVVIPNAGGASPDLSTDIDAVVSAGAGGGALKKAIDAHRAGFQQIAAGTVLTQAQARAVLNSDDAAGAVLSNQMAPRTVITLTPRTGNIAWSVDANVVAGNPVIEVFSDVGEVGTAYVDLKRNHSDDQ